MSDRKLAKSEIAAVIRCKEILGKIGCGSELNISKVCESAGISRKSAYKYEKQHREDEQAEMVGGQEVERLEKEKELLEKRLKEVELENEGLRIAKMIVDDLKKKGLT